LDLQYIPIRDRVVAEIRVCCPRDCYHEEDITNTHGTAINADASDPVLASKLRQIGPVASNPYQSHTSTQYVPPSRQAAKGLPAEFAPLGNEPPPGLFPDPATMRNNPALLVMQARKRWQEKAEAELEEVGRSGFVGREMMDVGMVTDALRMRRRGVGDADIEKRLGLRSGVLRKLGPPGVTEAGYAS
jgi:hypothetical protein